MSSACKHALACDGEEKKDTCYLYLCLCLSCSLCLSLSLSLAVSLSLTHSVSPPVCAAAASVATELGSRRAHGVPSIQQEYSPGEMQSVSSEQIHCLRPPGCETALLQ